MRKSVLVACMVSAAISVLLLATPLLINSRQTLEQQEFGIMEYYAERVQLLLNDPKHIDSTLKMIQNDRVMYYQLYAGDQMIIAAGASNLPVDGLPVSDLAAAYYGRVGRVHANGVMGVTVPLQGSDKKLRVLRSDAKLVQQTRANTAKVLFLGALTLLVAFAVGLLVARRITKPIDALAATAQRLGEGDFTVRAPMSGNQEIDTLAAALNTTAQRLSVTVERQRQFNADASHQLKTPLTALRLNLEALEFTDADPSLVQAALNEVDRLDTTIQETLALADLPQGDQIINVHDLIVSRMSGWETLAQAQDRQIVITGEPQAYVRARPAAVNQALQVLVDNALEHGSGTITIDVASMERANNPTWTRIAVHDEGEGFQADYQPGRGLRLARSLIQAEGGRLRIGEGPVACLLVPSLSADDALLFAAASKANQPAPKWRFRNPISSEKA